MGNTRMNKGRRQELKGGDEEDVVCGRKWYQFKPGILKWTKRKMNKRLRQEGKRDANSDD